MLRRPQRYVSDLVGAKPRIQSQTSCWRVVECAPGDAGAAYGKNVGANNRISTASGWQKALE